jgi:UDP-2,3-diacylglucosamine pyrophosphatase LpxH
MLTEKQQEIWDLMQQGMSGRAIARKLGKSESSVRASRNAIKKKMTQHPTNPLFKVDKVSELINNRTGESVMTWYKSSKEAEDMAQLVEDLIDRAKRELPSLPKVPKPKNKTLKDDLFNAFYLGDPHMNMLSWARETGKDWDLDIALAHHDLAMSDLIDRAPSAGEGMLCTLGDLFHNDSLKAVTPGSGNIVDVDGRLLKSWDATIIMVERMLLAMLRKYKKVHYVCVPGNHSETLERLFASTLKIAFRGNKRLIVHDNVRKHIPFKWENNFILATHGDKMNNQKKADVAVGKFREYHGNSKFTHVVSGHLHHTEQKELSGALVETFSVLPPPDAWHVESGYVTSRQAAHQVTYHKNGGIYSRSETNPRIYLEE